MMTKRNPRRITAKGIPLFIDENRQKCQKLAEISFGA